MRCKITSVHKINASSRKPKQKPSHRVEKTLLKDNKLVDKTSTQF